MTIPNKVVLFYLGLFNYKCLGDLQIDKVYATTGAAVTLDCSKVAVNGSRWSRQPNRDHNTSYILYTDGTTINPHIRNKERIRIIYDQRRGIYQLKILKVSETDEGKYSCSYLLGTVVHEYYVSLKITRPPSNLKFLNNNRGFIAGTEGHNVTISCLVDSGVPPETLYLQSTNGLAKEGSHGHINHSLVLNRPMNGTSFTCEAKSDQLVVPLVSQIQLLIKYKPTVHIEEGSRLIVKEGDNLVLTCNFSCYPDLRSLEWKHMSYIVDEMNTKYGSTRRLEISQVRTTHSGAFICKVTNEIHQ
ncbi:cell adhesion molecule 4-like [Mytilus trossulus]|uniref:cell adhesion molecule 4-like n=1 Tax=Mytilus trossulus TaxID=6551 RepID=UPI0030070257